AEAVPPPADAFVWGAPGSRGVPSGDGLPPGRLGPGGGGGGRGPGGRAVTGRVTACLACPQRVEADIRGDPVEPCGKGPRPVVCAEPAPGPLQRVLNRVLGVGARPKHAVAVAKDSPLLRP